MDLLFLKHNWMDLRIIGKQVIILPDMLKRFRGELTILGRTVLEFEPMSPEIDRIILSITETNRGVHCYKLDEDLNIWDDLGIFYFRYEWGKHLLVANWKKCGIRLPGIKKVVPLQDIFSECLGEKFDGVKFIGKGILAGKNPLLRLDTQTNLQQFTDEQRCEIFSTETDEWEYWGMFVKYIYPA